MVNLQDLNKPVAWYDEEMDSAYTASELGDGNVDGLVPLYTTPQPPAPAVPDLLFQLQAAANYIDTLGGVSKGYRAAIAAHEAKKGGD